MNDLRHDSQTFGAAMILINGVLVDRHFTVVMFILGFALQDMIQLNMT